MVQATTPTIDTQEAQTNAPATDEQTLVAATGAGEAAGNGAEAAQAPTFDFTSEDGVRAAIAANPTLQKVFEQQQTNGFNAGRQNRDKELRLERGTEETARAWQQHLMEKYGVELDEADRRESPLWVRANRDTERANLWRTNAEVVLDAFDVSERAAITAALEQFDGLPDQMEQIGRQVVDEAVKRQTHKRVGALTLDDIPKDSSLWTAVQAHVRSEVDKELEARAAEKPAVDNPPRTPVGGAATQKTRADYAHLSPQQIADLPPAEYAIAQGWGT